MVNRKLLINKLSVKGKPWVIKYGLALSSIIYILFPGLYKSDILWHVSPFLMLIPSIIVTSWYGGFGPGICATIVGLLVGDYFFLHPVYTFTISNNEDVIRMVLFGIIGFLISILSQLLHNALRKAKEETENLRQSEEKLRILIEGAKDYAIFLLDVEGRIRTWNHSAEFIYGYKSSEVITKPFSLFFSDKKNNITDKLLQTAKENGKAEGQYLQVKNNTEKYWANIIITPSKDSKGKIQGFVVVTKDISQQVELDKQKSTFLHVVAHELKTPIAILRVITHVLIDEYKKVIDKTVINDLSSELERLTILVDDLLDISRIERGKLSVKKSPVNITAVIAQVVKRMEILADDHILEWKQQKNIVVAIDETRIKQVLVNLIGNAIKHSPKKSRIWVLLEDKDTEVVVSVHDRGVGISEKEQPFIFGMFYQVQDYFVKGFGLGLYISKEIVTQHKGRIWVTSELGKGSTFSFSLPK